jgi:hypothetical protein
MAESGKTIHIQQEMRISSKMQRYVLIGLVGFIVAGVCGVTGVSQMRPNFLDECV